MNRYRDCVLAMASLSVGLLVAAPARAAGTYQMVTQSDWWAGVTGLPSYVNMYDYVPSTLASKPPIVVYSHHCQGSAKSSHDSNGTLESIADKNGFIIIYPEATGENCWDAGSPRSLKHDGGGDTGAVVQMVKYTLSKYGGDAGRVYAAGDSSGGIMTEALLGVYPDVFMAGVSIMGVPCGCWADGYNDVTGKPADGTGQWSGACAGGTNTKTGQQWGDLVRSYFPGYTGHRPRLQHWHGAADTTLNYKNVAEDIKEWTNLLGLGETPTGTEANTPKSGTTHQFWKNSCFTVYETFVLAGVGHAVSFDGNAGAAYFGLDKAGGQDPETAACPGAVPGGGGTVGAGGVTGSGGGIGPGGATGAGGRDAAIPGSGGVQADGSSGSGGSVGTGGAGGSSGNGGGGSSKGGTSGNGGDVGAGGGIESGGSPAPAGGGSGGAHATGGHGGNSGSGGSTATSSSSGCSCALGNQAERRSALATTLLFAALGLLICRQKRRVRRCKSALEHEARSTKHEDQ